MFAGLYERSAESLFSAFPYLAVLWPRSASEFRAPTTRAVGPATGFFRPATDSPTPATTLFGRMRATVWFVTAYF